MRGTGENRNEDERKKKPNTESVAEKIVKGFL